MLTSATGPIPSRPYTVCLENSFCRRSARSPRSHCAASRPRHCTSGSAAPRGSLTMSLRCCRRCSSAPRRGEWFRTTRTPAQAYAGTSDHPGTASSPTRNSRGLDVQLTIALRLRDIDHANADFFPLLLGQSVHKALLNVRSTGGNPAHARRRLTILHVSEPEDHVDPMTVRAWIACVSCDQLPPDAAPQVRMTALLDLNGDIEATVRDSYIRPFFVRVTALRLNVDAQRAQPMLQVGQQRVAAGVLRPRALGAIV